MKRNSVFGLVIAAALSSNMAMAEEGLKGGLGLGIPYGLIGGNLEYGFNDYLAVTAGAGITPAGMGWAVGARVYGPKMGELRPRITALHGVVAVLETVSYWTGESDYENLTGEAFGVGAEWTMPSGYMLELDILGVSGYEVPAGASQKGGDVVLSIGFAVPFN